MRKTACSATILLGTLIGSVAAAHAADPLGPLGEWLVEDKVATIRIVDCAGHLWGVVASEKIPGGLDSSNPDKTKRTRPTLGIPVLLNMQPSADEKDKWEGHIYNAKDGKTYEASISLTSPNVLKVEGCVLGFLCGGQNWTRVEPGTGIPGAPATGAKTSAVPPAPGTGKTASPAPAPGSGAKMAGPAGANVPHTTGQKVAPGQNAGAAVPATPDLDPVCLIPDIAGTTH